MREGLQANAGGLALFAVASDGTLVTLPGPSTTNARLVWVTRTGRVEPFDDQVRSYGDPTLSSDGTVVAVAVDDGAGSSDIWTFDVKGGVPTRVTFGGPASDPEWLPDSRRLAYRLGNASGGMFVVSANGSGTLERILDDGTPTSVSPDGKVLAFIRTAAATATDIWVLPLAGNRGPQLFVGTPANERAATFSPNGQWLAYTSAESGSFEVYEPLVRAARPSRCDRGLRK
jgi:Tol biopolymer transport system component